MEEIKLSGGGRFDTEIVGEQYYLKAVADLLKGESKIILDAVLILDDKNPYDKNAVKVNIENQQVGYLSRELAVIFRKHLRTLGHPTASARCRAKLIQSPPRENNKKYFDIYLDLPDLLIG